MDVDDWLRDVEVEPPCGPNLEYDDAYMTLAAAAAGKPEQQYGDTLIAAVEPDWKQVLDQSSELLTRTKDLRATLLLTRALTRLEGLQGFLKGIELTHRLLEAHWDQVHPRLDIDGEADPFMRANALSGLADEAGMLRDLRAASLIATPAGPITVRAAEAVLKPVADGTAPSVRGDGIGALRTREDALRALDTVCDFLSRSEPSNPAPLLIRRAQRLIGSDFLAIMRDMVPESLVQIEAIAGIRHDASAERAG
jgi:type VI secretion system protein ImpA